MSLADLFATRTRRKKTSEIRELLKLLDRPGILSFAGGSDGNAPRLSFSCASPDQIDEGMKRLGLLLRDA